VSTRPGTEQFSSVAAGAVLGSAGRAIALGNGDSPAAISSLLVTYVASATAGSRQVLVQVKTASGVILWQVAAAAITAGQTVILAIGSGVPASTVASPLMQFLTLPFDLPAPQNAIITILDSANIDPNSTTGDTAALVANYAL
jgi:hypothetical protein